MKIAIMQPYLFPYIGYFQLINSVDKFVIYDDVNYIKQGWINRNSVLVQDKLFLFTLPLERPSSFAKINEIKINEKQYKNWTIKFLKTLEQSYKKAPFFNETYDLISRLINLDNDTISISHFNYTTLIELSKYLGIKTKFVKSSTIYKNSDLKGQERLLDICEKEQVTTYINPIGGIELYDKAEFKKNGIDLYFIKTNPLSYKQFSNEFLPWLSIIDVMMFNSPEEINEMLYKFEFI